MLHYRDLSWWEERWPGGIQKHLAARSVSLRKAFEDLLGDRRRESFFERDKDEDPDSWSRTLVLATDLDAISSPALFASYLRGVQDEYSIIDVMMAAVAIPEQMLPVFLTPVNKPMSKTPNMECVSASITGHANPCLQALIGAKNMSWTIYSLLSIGCGIRSWGREQGWGRSNSPNQQLADAAEVTGRVATDPERIEVQVDRLCKHKIDYHRFNVPNGVVKENIGD